MPKIAFVASAGMSVGSTTRLNVRNSDAPSMRAASTISLEKFASKYCLKKNTPPGAAIAGMMSGTYVS